MSARVEAMVSRRYELACGARGMFALEADARKAVKTELEARRDELRRRLDAAHVAVLTLARDLAACEMDLKELGA